MAIKGDEELEDEDKGLFSWRSAKERFSSAKDKTNEFVKENPWKSVAISAAVGAGVALGIAALVGRRRDETFWDRLRNLF